MGDDVIDKIGFLVELLLWTAIVAYRSCLEYYGFVAPVDPGSRQGSYLNAVSQELHFDWRKAACPEARNGPQSLGCVLEQR
jgi:hypothetical protein